MRTRGPLTVRDLEVIAAFQHLLVEVGAPGTPLRSPAHAYRVHFAVWKMGEPPSTTLRRDARTGALS